LAGTIAAKEPDGRAVALTSDRRLGNPRALCYRITKRTRPPTEAGPKRTSEEAKMSESVTETTNEFLVQRNDGSQGTVLELTTFLIHRETRHRAAIQVDYFLDGVSLIRDQSDPDVVP